MQLSPNQMNLSNDRMKLSYIKAAMVFHTVTLFFPTDRAQKLLSIIDFSL